MVSQIHNRLYQQDEYEKAVLGCILTSSECLKNSPELTIEFFQSDKHRDLFQAIIELQFSESPIDSLTVAEQLEKNGCLKSIGGASFLLNLMESTPNIENFVFYTSVIQKQYTTLEYKKLLEQGIEDLRNGKEIEEVATEISGFDYGKYQENFEWLTAAELHAGDHKLEYFIDQVFVKNQPLVMAGGQKTCKTNVASDLAISLATGQPFLGKFHINGRYNVSFISCESGVEVLQDNNRRVAFSKNVAPDAINNLHYCFDVLSLDNQRHLQQLRVHIEKTKTDVCIIDPFYLTANLGNDAGNLFIVGEKLKPLAKLMRDTGCTIVLIHHTRKNTGQNAFVKPRMEDIAYSGLPQWMRQWILLGRREAYDGDTPGSHKLWLDAGGSAGHSASFELNIEEGSQHDEDGRRWNIEVISAQEAKLRKQTEQKQKKQDQKEAQSVNDIQKVLELLKDASKPLTASKIKADVNLQTGRNNAALDALVLSGQVNCEKMRADNGRTFNHYFIATGTAGSNGKENMIPLSRPSEHRERERPPCKGGLPTPALVSESVSEQREDSELFDGLNDIFPPDENNRNFQEHNQ